MKGRAIDVYYNFDLVWSSHAIPRDLFSPLYCWKIAELTLNSNHSLISRQVKKYGWRTTTYAGRWQQIVNILCNSNLPLFWYVYSWFLYSIWLCLFLKYIYCRDFNIIRKCTIISLFLDITSGSFNFKVYLYNYIWSRVHFKKIDIKVPTVYILKK
jgi:hypothetical protein